MPLQQLPALSTDPEFTYVTNPTAGIPDFLALNTTKAPFDNPVLRQAIALAVDKPQIRDIAYFGAGEVGSMEVPSGSPWYGATDPLAAGPDIEAAKAKLAEAGIETPLTINYLGLPQYPELLKTGEVVREQLKAIGIEMIIEPVDVSVWFDRFVNGDYEMTSAYQERTIDPDNFYALVLKSGGSINTTGYSNPEFDALIDQARTETDEATRKCPSGSANLIHYKGASLSWREASGGWRLPLAACGGFGKAMGVQIPRFPHSEFPFRAWRSLGAAKQ